MTVGDPNALCSLERKNLLFVLLIIVVTMVALPLTSRQLGGTGSVRQIRPAPQYGASITLLELLDQGATDAKSEASLSSASNSATSNSTALSRDTTTPRSTTASRDNATSHGTHVFFLKVHKAASSTVQNIMLRYGLARNQLVAMPRKSHLFSERSKKWSSNVLPLPPGRHHYDILCNHLVFHEPSVRSLLPPDAVYIGIVREPFHQFVSAFVYYRDRWNVKYLKKIPGPDPISTYLTNPSKYEMPDVPLSRTHNKMSFDFGLEPDAMNDSRKVSDYLQYLNKTFHLVMVSEHFAESMVLMRRTLGWTLKDVLYRKNNVFKHKKRNFTDRQRDTHRRFNMADYMLYKFFTQEFDRKVTAQGPSFLEEVKRYISVLDRVTKYCALTGWKAPLVIEASQWNEKFAVPRDECQHMKRDEVSFVNYVRAQQY